MEDLIRKLQHQRIIIDFFEGIEDFLDDIDDIDDEENELYQELDDN